MDPINNPTPTPSPTPAPAPTTNPISSSASTSTPASSPALDSTPMPEPVLPPVPSSTPELVSEEPSSVATSSSANVQFPAADQSSATPPQPVNPVIAPSQPINPVINPSQPASLHSAFQPVSDGVMAAGTSVGMTESEKAPGLANNKGMDMTMEAAGPAPGSIGSAVSGPASGLVDNGVLVRDNPFGGTQNGRTQSVSFNDPATDSNMMSAKDTKNRKTLYILIGIAGFVVLVLLIVFLMQMFGQ